MRAIRKRRTGISFGVAVIVLMWCASTAAPAGATTHIPATTYNSATTWTRAGSPYVLDGGVTVGTGATLTIEPGVVVKLNGQSRRISVNGTLQAVGTPTERVTFTSLQDDSIAGDTGGDGQTAGARGQWMEITVKGNATFDWATVRYGGNNCCGGHYAYGAINGYRATSVELDHTIIEHNQHSGLLVGSGGATPAEVNSSWIHDNGLGISLLGSGPLHLGQGSIVEANDTYGVEFQVPNDYAGPASTVNDSDITGNGSYGIYTWAYGSPQTASLPHGNRNNIYANGPANGGLYNQLYPVFGNGLNSDWENNYWGEGVEFRANPPGCAFQGNMSAGRLAYTASTADPPEGPIKASRYYIGTYPYGSYCGYDFADVLPFSAEYIQHPDSPAGDADQLLPAFEPVLYYDAQETFRADWAAEMTNNYRSGGEEFSNFLNRADGSHIAAANPTLGYPQLGLGFLQAEFANYPSGGAAASSDYIDAANNYVDDAIAMHYLEGYGDFLHTRYVTSAEGPILQYWLFYYDNPKDSALSTGEHEGDWEMVQIHLDLAGQPTGATYAQHGDPKYCQWSSVTKTAGRPNVFVGLGSHASFFTPGVHGSDTVIPDPDVEPTSTFTPVDITDPPAWVRWPGRWGATQPELPADQGGESPPGPMHQGTSWDDPGAWSDGAPSCE